MLLTGFYDILEKDEKQNGANFQILLHSSHDIYKGHFPGQPVLPGVCTLQIIKECSEQITQKPLLYQDILNCKFLSSIDPKKNSKISLAISIVKNNETLFLTATGTYEDNIFIKLKASMKII